VCFNKLNSVDVQTRRRRDDVNAVSGEATTKCSVSRAPDENNEDLPSSQKRQRPVTADADLTHAASLIREIAAPLLAAELRKAFAQSTGGTGNQRRVAVPSRRQSDGDVGGRWAQTAAVMSRRPAVKIASYDMVRASSHFRPVGDYASPTAKRSALFRRMVSTSGTRLRRAGETNSDAPRS